MKGGDGDVKGKIIWYQKVRNISNFSSIERTNGKYKRLYVDVYRNEK